MGEPAKDVGKLAPTLHRGVQSAFNASAVQFINQRLAPDKTLDQAQALATLQQADDSQLQTLENSYRDTLAYQLGAVPPPPPAFDAKMWTIGSGNVAVYLALLVMVGFLAVLFLFFVSKIFPIPDFDKSREILVMLLGALTTVMVQVIQFFFGSSASSAGKNQLLAQQAQSGK